MYILYSTTDHADKQNATIEAEHINLENAVSIFLSSLMTAFLRLLHLKALFELLDTCFPIRTT